LGWPEPSLPIPGMAPTCCTDCRHWT
jgi:hypothetical protein